MAATRSPRSPVKSASPCHDEASGKSDVARAPTPNVARAPLCPAMAGTAMTVLPMDRFVVLDAVRSAGPPGIEIPVSATDVG